MAMESGIIAGNNQVFIYRIGACFLLSGLVLSSSVLAQSSIILNTPPENTEIPLASGTTVGIDPITGDITATPADPNACSATVDCADVNVQIQSFSANPSQVAQGQNINFTWASRGAWSCVGSGLPGTSWNTGIKLPSGSQSVSTTGLAVGDYDVELECSNGPVTDQSIRSITIEIDNGNGDPNCTAAGRLPPAGISRDTAILDNSSILTRTWEEFYGQDFPNGPTRIMAVRRDQYAALSFNSGSLPTGTRGIINLNNPQFAAGDAGRKLVTISQCEGDFTPQPDNPNCVQLVGAGGNFQWSFNQVQGTRCVIEPNTDYYFNILFTDDETSFDWQCTESDTPQTEAECHTITSAVGN